MAAAQRPDGYLNTYVQVVKPGHEYQDLAWGHELYCVGHLIQAAVAWQRALGDDRLLAVAIRAADSVDRELGPGGRLAIDGHPEIEMALVELFRTTGERRYLELAARMIEARGDGLLGTGRFGPAYWQDHERVRDAATVAGHAVRQLYLDCGAVDVATELGDTQLLDAVVRRWRDMVATRMYLTGGLGSRHADESFGDPFELPPDGAYAETCAAIASVMLAWRLLLATGDHGLRRRHRADDVQRRPARRLARRREFLLRQLVAAADRASPGQTAERRTPAVVRLRLLPAERHARAELVAAIPGDDRRADGIQIHQFATAEIDAPVADGAARLAMQTGYPWDGSVRITVTEAPRQPWTLSLRVPAWCESAALRAPGGREHADPVRTHAWRR